MYAFPETPIIHRINKNDLSTEEKVCINDHIAIVHHTSHPHVMNDGTVYNLAMSIGILGPTHRIVCFPNEKNNGCENDGIKYLDNVNAFNFRY